MSEKVREIGQRYYPKLILTISKKNPLSPGGEGKALS